ncbi:MAG TPA: type II toxin-antitoxin system RelE/ParE family toxin [Chloroflexi bacterium]|nr:MAG: addiction module antitoxin [Anaerolineaceae bacterium 4572_5.2]HEY83774.1 type II toxin-antitoxin system RelE/ParE family toxin [Chloroflexota bacterium]
MYEIRILDETIHDLQRLDKAVGRRVVKRINWLATNMDNINRERLTGNLSEFYKFRIGDYRILYQVLEDEHIIVIHQVGHRREIYR